MAELPTKEDLARLTPRALVAYAARCARRVQPLFRHPDEKHVRAVDDAIRVAETFVATGTYPRAEANAYGEAITIAAEAAKTPYASSAARAASYAEATAFAAANVTAETAANAAAGATTTYANATNATTASKATAAEAARHDFNQLKAIGTREPDTKLGRPIDLTALGPLWPEGEPEWFREASSEIASKSSDLPNLTVYIEPGDAPTELIKELFVALSAAYRAHGGSGLKIVKEERRSLVGELVP